MKILMQLAIIFGICWLGEVVSALLPFAFPPAVIDMILVFLFLLSGKLKVAHISSQANFLLDNMAFLFVPSVVTIVEYLPYLEGTLLPVLFICFITIFTTFAITSWTVTAMIKWEAKRKGRA